MASVEETGVHGQLAWVCDLHALNSVQPSGPAPGTVPHPPAKPASTADSRRWATHLVGVWSQLAVPVTGRPETGSV
ncbi:hypothetical protein OG311_00750 [Streptomyces sp. NBC_01343]|uniref:hypothetical protein n=1 Tax=Streptomyces sp. NBC_01343 TaxID=2903832 RepID=UPI002E160AA8|nr:hypothetical protein OG311_00750 [Streptomyces sp. NBC_01343]